MHACVGPDGYIGKDRGARARDITARSGRCSPLRQRFVP